MKRYAQIVGWGMYVPEKIITNQDLERMVDTSDEWIRTRTGIIQRRVAAPKESTATLATRAAQAAIQVADLSPSKIDLVIVATVTPDYLFPAVSCLVQDALGASHAGAMDVNSGCSGFVYGVAVAGALISSGVYDNILVIGSETLTRITDWSDRNTCILFGDGAGAVLMQATDTPTGLMASVLGSDGSGANIMLVPGGGSRHPPTLETVQNRLHYIKMDGKGVFRFAVPAIAKATQQVVKEAGLTMDDIDLLIPHQANMRIMHAAAKAMDLPLEKVYSNVERYGNTSAATIPIALCEAIEEGRVSPGDHLVFVGFGAGLTWAAAALQWGVPAVVPEFNWWKNFTHLLRQQEATLRSFALRTGRRLEGLRHSNNGERH